MKHIKHLFFLSLVCSIVLFIACDEETGLGGDYDEEIAQLKQDIADNTNAINSINNRIDSLTNAITTLSNDLDDLSKEVQDNISANNLKIDSISSSLNDLQSSVTNNNSSVDSLDAQYNSIAQSILNLISNIETLDSLSDKASIDLSELTTSVSDLAKIQDKSILDITQLSLDYEGVLKKYQELLSQLQAVPQINILSGAVFKGSFLEGSLLNFYELDSNLYQTGKSYNATIEDNFGNYTLQAVGLENSIFRVVGDGFYWNEVLNENSDSRITLTGICKIDSNELVNVNVLTHLERPRFEYLYSQKGYSFDSAKREAVSDVLGVFGFKNTGITRAEKVGVAGIRNDSKILLAISTLIQGFRTESEVTQLFNNIAEDIKTDGILSDSTIGNDIATHLYYMDTATMLSNFKTRYATKYASDTINTLDMSFIKRFQDSTNYSKDKDLIEYPEFDSQGNKNILFAENTSFIGNYFGFACVIKNEGLSVRAELTNTDGTAVSPSHFGFALAQNFGWIVKLITGSGYVPVVTSNGIGTYDFYVGYGWNNFVYGQHKINIYYNNSSTPKEVRFIDLLE
ncbi:MAG: hypothetical protein ACKVLJ_11535 [Cytophagales bacterium]